MAAVPADILGFWTAAGPSKWFAKSAAFDDAVRLKFEPVHHAAARGQYDRWADSCDGALAHAFATDPLARRIARSAIERGFDATIQPLLRPFFYSPFHHCEDLIDQDYAVALYEAHDAQTGDIESLKWAVSHREIIRRFGRFPHRNPALGRITTPAEQTFLDERGFSG